MAIGQPRFAVRLSQLKFLTDDSRGETLTYTPGRQTGSYNDGDDDDDNDDDDDDEDL